MGLSQEQRKYSEEITKINDSVYITGIVGVTENSIPDDVDRVITVCQDHTIENVSCAYEWYKMKDGGSGYGGDDSYELFEQAAHSMLSAIQNGETILIHCHVGRSRSVSVAIAAMATDLFENMSAIPQTAYDVIYGIIHEKRGFVRPKITLKDHAIRFISENA